MRESEIKILEKLKEKKEGLSFSELEKETGYSYQTLSICLKNLQKENLIVRDPENRKYKIYEGGLKELYKNEIISLLKEAEERDLYPLSLFSNNDFLLRELNNIYKEDKKFREAIIYIIKIINDQVKKYIFKFNYIDIFEEPPITHSIFSKEEKIKIRKYEQGLLQFYKFLRCKKAKTLPFIDLNKEKFYDQLSIIDDVYFLKKFYEEESLEDHKIKLNRKEKQKIGKIKKVLENKNYKKIYEKYLDILSQIKIVLIYSKGFKK